MKENGKSPYLVLRMDKDPKTKYGLPQYRFWYHDSSPEWRNYQTNEAWILDCLKEGYYIGLVGKFEEVLTHI